MSEQHTGHWTENPQSPTISWQVLTTAAYGKLCEKGSCDLDHSEPNREEQGHDARRPETPFETSKIIEKSQR